MCRAVSYNIDMRHKHPFKGSINGLAKILGISRGHLSEVLNHHTTPSLTLALAIQKETRGRIKAKDLVAGKGKPYDRQSE